MSLGPVRGGFSPVSTRPGFKPDDLFAPEVLVSLVDTHFEGENTKSLASAMNALRRALRAPEGQQVEGALAALAKARNRPLAEIKNEWQRTVTLHAQQKTNGYESNELSWAHLSYAGSTTQLRYGYVVGQALGIDAAFGALLNPTGGIAGAGNYGVDGGETAMGYHAVVHDAAGYLVEAHRCGPGWNYLGHETRPSGPLTGVRAGIAFFNSVLADHRRSPAAQTVMELVVPAVDWFKKR